MERQQKLLTDRELKAWLATGEAPDVVERVFRLYITPHRHDHAERC